MILNDKKINGLNVISENFDEDRLQAASYDLTLDLGGETVKTLKPGESAMLSTKEVVCLPPNVAAKTVSKSSFARAGVSVGDIGGWVDPGFEGTLTLLVVNLGKDDFLLWNDTPFCQIVFMGLEESAENIYDGHYQNQRGVTQSRFMGVMKPVDNNTIKLYGEISD